jgi:hypothetical protein
MDQQEATKLISNMLQMAHGLIEGSLTLGREFDVPVNLNIVGLSGDDMWYVSPEDYEEEVREQYTEEELERPEIQEEIKERLREVAENNGYDSEGYKKTGWMSSSMQC